MKFYLGAKRASWLWSGDCSVPLFVSNRVLERYRRTTMKPSLVPWGLDSGGFTELNLYGEWKLEPRLYILRARRYNSTIGKLDFIAPQDWMCEPLVRRKTGKSVLEHQRLTVDNFLILRDLAPELPIIPVLQGWTRDDYVRCVEMYDKAGVNLLDAPRVGLGSVCRRQNMDEASTIVTALHRIGIKLHGFGFKIEGLRRVGHLLSSADSMAWSVSAQHNPRLAGCVHMGRCTGCLQYALQWREKVIHA